MRTLGRIFLLVSLSALAFASFPKSARAGGLFYAGSGTRPLGRGAAFHVRADDANALLYNPAKLADLEGAQFLANFNLALLDACMDPAGSVDSAVPDVEPGSDQAGVIRDRGTYKEHYSPNGGSDVTRFGTVPASATNSGLRRTWIGTTMPKVCNETALLPIPNFVFSYQFIKERRSWPANGKHGLTVAFGMVAPGAVAKTTWGDEDGTIRAKGHATKKQFDDAYGENGTGRLPAGVRPDVVCNPQTDNCSMYCDPDSMQTCEAGRQFFCDPSRYDCDRLPTPSRYMMVQQDPFAIPFTLGVGYRPLPWLAIGGAFTYQAVFFKSVVVAGQTTDGNPEMDMRVENELTDWFVPIAMGSLQVTPMQGLEFMGYFKWQDKIAGATKTTITDGTYTIGGQNQRLPVRAVIEAGDGVETSVPQPWEAGGGVRFALPRAGYNTPFQPINRQDAMENEVFDIEFDLVLEHNSSVDQFTLTSKENPLTVFQGFDYRDTEFNGAISPTDPKCQTSPGPQTALNRCVSDRNLRFLKEMKLKRAWKDQFAYRIGGDFNVIPGVLTVRAGWSLETRGINPSYQSVDAFPARRMGLHGGLTWRIGKKIDLSFAYAHLSQETIRVLHNDSIPPGPALDEDLEKDEAGLRLSPLDPNARAINAGTYAVAWDVFSIGLNQRF